MKISILTLFPEMFQSPFEYSIIKHAKSKKLVEIEYINIRDFGIGKHRMVDDTPYGGGMGMILRVDVLHQAIEHTKRIYSLNKLNSQTSASDSVKRQTILLSASGKTFRQSNALQYSRLDHLILICGHYEGVDDRIKNYIDEEISVGDFVVTGGEIPAMIITDATVRLIKGVLKKGVVENESFSNNIDGKILLEYPQFTRPAEYDNLKVPSVLVSGNHSEIEKWRKSEAIKKTGIRS